MTSSAEEHELRIRVTTSGEQSSIDLPSYDSSRINNQQNQSLEQEVRIELENTHENNPERQFALTMGLLTGREPEGDAAAACCECDRDRSTTTHVMDEQQLSLYNSSYDGADCRYQLLAETLEQPAQCLGGGPDTASCMADLGGPLVAADRFGSAFFLMGVASMRPSSRDCSWRPVTYAPVRPHMGWILDSMDKLSKPVSTLPPTPLRPRTSTRGKVSLSGTRPISPRLEATRRIAARKQSNPASRGWVWN